MAEMHATPFEVLGLSTNADEATVRARYLELVRQYPPERDPDRFRQIRAAYEAASDPLNLAELLLLDPAENAPTWANVLAEEAQHPPQLAPNFLLSLGNRAANDARQPKDAS